MLPSKDSEDSVDEGHPAAMTLQCAEDGDTDEAPRTWRQKLDLYKEILGEHHPETVTAMAHLASAYHACGKWAAAESYGLEALAATEKVLGQRAHATRLAVCVIAGARMHRGRPTEAEELYRDVIKSMKREPVSDVGLLVRAMECLSSLYLEQSRVEEAGLLTSELTYYLETFLRECIRFKESGRGHTLSVEGEIGHAYYKLGHDALAAQLLFRINKERQQTKNSGIQRPLNAPEQHCENILISLWREPASSRLQKWLDEWGKGLPDLDESSFFDCCKEFARLCGPDRQRYYSELKGFHYLNEFPELFNKAHAEHPVSELGYFRFQCPPTWSYITYPCLMLVYTGMGTPSEAMSDLIRGPTTLDCGMSRQVFIVVSIWRFMGNELFNKSVPIERLTISQGWLGDKDNLLWAFFDTLEDFPSRTNSDIQARTVYNHPLYLRNHPAGSGRLQNTISFRGEHVVFRPGRASVLSEEDLQQTLIAAYNAPRSAAGQFLLSMEATEDNIEHQTLSESQWKDSQSQRADMERGLQLTLNICRLNQCIEKVRAAHRNGTTPNDIISIGLEEKEVNMRNGGNNAAPIVFFSGQRHNYISSEPQPKSLEVSSLVARPKPVSFTVQPWWATKMFSGLRSR